MKVRTSFEKLVEIMDRLRGEGGCPWDREQTYETLRGYLLEECYEVAEAIDGGDRRALAEELGDLLFQIVFLSRLGKEERAFTVSDVIEGITTKMIRRHPHVFGGERAETSDDVLRKWEEIKRAEKEQAGGRAGRATSLLDGLPGALPELSRAQRLGEKAARVGFDWERSEQILDKIDEELAELRAAHGKGDPGAVRDELGDCLFALAMLARRMGLDAEGALSGANRKFRKRFGWIEAELRRAGRSFEETGAEELERLWSRAKRE